MPGHHQKKHARYALIKPERLPTKLESEFNLRGKLRAAAYVVVVVAAVFLVVVEYNNSQIVRAQ